MSAFSRRSLLGVPLVAYLWARSALARAQSIAAPANTDWRSYAGDLANTRYSPLAQINADNFNDLEVAWRFKPDAFGSRPEFNLQSTPLVIKGVMYTTVGTRRDVVALDAATGELLWMHRLDEGARADAAPRKLSGRGLAYWTDGAEERILYVTPGYRLVALNARTGLAIAGFGEDGIVDLKQNDDQEIGPLNDDIGLHATPCVAKDVVIVGAAHSVGNAPKHHHNVAGYVRGFDVRTGQRLWIFHTIPRKGEFGYDTWLDGTDQIGNAGVWAQISADEELNLAYLPVELPTGDFNGGFRRGAGLFGESIVAVDLHTGVRRWHFQTVHHGLWDYDIPCAPILCDIPVGGKMVKALAQPTKQSFLYVLDRTTGKPIWPIRERPVPKGDVPGEWYSPTQPFPSKPPAYDVQGITENDLIDFTPALRAEALELVKNYRMGPLFTPASVWSADGTWGTLTAPNATGGANWPGGSYDPESHILYIYSKTEADVDSAAQNKNPQRSDFDYVNTRGNPPPGEKPVARGAFRPGVLQVQGLPLMKPPYGRITAIDLSKGEIAWQIAHGETPDEVRNHPALKGLKLPRTGRPGLLGTLATKTLVICGEAGFFTTPTGKRGAMLRAYDKATGAEKGAVFLPAPQTGSPMTYMLGGVQYIVLAIGGGSYSAELVAFRLPKA
ncbi:MAG: quinoprotein glucose dehydrogenase [Caulobacteraceae bacterium]|nr:quinoprotein glucose dehydrogenase [Caulobacteraceae bacterium]